jgi:spore maturation protein CgeB
MEKILILCSTLDLTKPYGATPALWQLFKALHEEGLIPLIIPYLGSRIDSLWWHSFQNPNYYKGMLIERIMKILKSSTTVFNTSLFPHLARFVALPPLSNLVCKILHEEQDVESMLIIGVPLNQITGMAVKVRSCKNIPIIYYDLDLPTSLPSHGGFSFNYYKGSDLSEYNSFLVTSEGSIPELKEIGAEGINIVHFGVDPDTYSPLELKQDVDFFFFGSGSKSRANNINMMITEPSRILKYKFIVSGRGLDTNLGNATKIPPVPFVEWRKYCCRAKVNLNVVREEHAKIFATSTSRPFELAAMKCCIVSAPYNGIEKWFEVGKEILVANSMKECLEIYQTLIDDKELRMKIGMAALNRVKKEHTSRHRARQIIDIINRCKT